MKILCYLSMCGILPGPNKTHNQQKVILFFKMMAFFACLFSLRYTEIITLSP